MLPRAGGLAFPFLTCRPSVAVIAALGPERVEMSLDLPLTGLLKLLSLDDELALYLMSFVSSS